MAHNINTYVGRQAAWHNLGTVTGNYLTLDEVLKARGINFEVAKRQLEYAGRPVEAWGTFRQDNGAFLGPVGSDYTVIQHAEGFQMLDALVADAGQAHFETAGVLGKGETVWGLIDLAKSISVGGQDKLGAYLLFATSHNGTMSHCYRTTFTRVVCQNTLNIAMASKTAAKLAIRHTKNAQLRIDKAHEALAEIGDGMKSVEAKLNFLAGRKVTKETLTGVLDKLFPKSKDEDGQEKESTRRNNTLIDILQRYDNNDGNVFVDQRGTAYNLLNAVTEYVDHGRQARGGNNSESAMFGSGDRLKSQALEVITLAANGMPAKERPVYVLPKQLQPITSLLDEIVAAHS